jgi:FeS assembly SUF system protein
MNDGIGHNETETPQHVENVAADANTDGNSSSPDLKDRVLAAIKTVYDPEIPVDIYELGLIYEINVYPVNNVYIQMTLTSPSCPSAEVIPGEVQQKIKAIEGVNDVKVDVTFDPPYSQDMMSEAAKLELGFM